MWGKPVSDHMHHASGFSLLLISCSQLYHVEIKNSQLFHNGNKKLGILNPRLLLWIVGYASKQKAMKTEKNLMVKSSATS